MWPVAVWVLGRVGLLLPRMTEMRAAIYLWILNIRGPAQNLNWANQVGRRSWHSPNDLVQPECSLKELGKLDVYQVLGKYHPKIELQIFTMKRLFRYLYLPSMLTGVKKNKNFCVDSDQTDPCNQGQDRDAGKALQTISFLRTWPWMRERSRCTRSCATLGRE